MELRMEFYLNILQDFAAASENILAVFTGRKFMLAAKVKFLTIKSHTSYSLLNVGVFED